MTNFVILYASAAVLASSAMITLGVIAMWMRDELRLRDAPQIVGVGFPGLGDDALAIETPQTAP